MGTVCQLVNHNLHFCSYFSNLLCFRSFISVSYLSHYLMFNHLFYLFPLPFAIPNCSYFLHCPSFPTSTISVVIIFLCILMLIWPPFRSPLHFILSHPSNYHIFLDSKAVPLVFESKLLVSGTNIESQHKLPLRLSSGAASIGSCMPFRFIYSYQ